MVEVVVNAVVVVMVAEGDGVGAVCQWAPRSFSLQGEKGEVSHHGPAMLTTPAY